MAYAHIDDYYLEHFYLLTRNEIIVFCYLLKKRNSLTKQCNPKLSTIATETNLKAPRVSEAVKGLEAKSWVVWATSGDFIINEKVTQCVTSQVTNCVRKSYALRKKKLRNAEEKVTHCVTTFKRIGTDKEQTSEKRTQAITIAQNPKHFATAVGADEETTAEQIYREFFGGICLNPEQQKLFAQIKNFEIWEKVCQLWKDNGSRASMLGNMIDRYQKELKFIPKPMQRKYIGNNTIEIDWNDPLNPFLGKAVIE